MHGCIDGNFHEQANENNQVFDDVPVAVFDGDLEATRSDHIALLPSDV
jgi:hypothetical protein